MKRTINELLENFRAIVGENTDDTVLNFLEDLSDSYSNNSEYDNLLNEYNGLKKRYRDRFFGVEDGADNDPEPEPEPENNEDIKINDLFTEE